MSSFIVIRVKSPHFLDCKNPEKCYRSQKKSCDRREKGRSVMVIMTSSSTVVTREGDEDGERRRSEDGTPTHSHRRRWSTPIGSGGESLHESFTVRSHECGDHRGASGVNLDEYFSCSSSDNSYSFYLGGEVPPLVTESRPQMLPKTRGEERRGRSVTRKRDLPPFLTTLDCNGRPRFHHRRVRSEGRLEIASVAVDLPEIVSVRGKEGLRIGTVRVSHEGEEGERDYEQDH